MQVLEQLRSLVLGGHSLAVRPHSLNCELWVFRRLVGVVYPCEALELPSTCLGVSVTEFFCVSVPVSIMLLGM
jgi:hypothetical protein